MASWEHFSHGSDIGVRGIGSSAEEAFEQAAIALTAVVADVGAIEQSEMVEVQCDAPDLELLLVSWLNAIIYEMAVRRMLFSKFRIVLAWVLADGHAGRRKGGSRTPSSRGRSQRGYGYCAQSRM